ncbi:MAG: hypothetical protein WD226_11650 [Planctomycetota bacterium]
MSSFARYLALGTLVLAATGCASWLRPIAPPRNGPSHEGDRQSVRELLTGSESLPERAEAPRGEAPGAEPLDEEPPDEEPPDEEPPDEEHERDAPPQAAATDASSKSGAASPEPRLDEGATEAPAPPSTANEAGGPPNSGSSAERRRVPEKEARLAVGDPITARAKVPTVPERASRLLLGDRLIGVEACDARGVQAGFVRDLLIERNTGDVVAALTHSEEADGVLRLLLFRGIRWDEDAAAVVVAPAELREPEWLDLFELQESREISGLVVDVELIVKSEQTTLSVLLRNPENLLHRVAITPGELALRALPELQPGLEVYATGVETRDDRGKLFLPNSLRIGSLTLPLRDATGTVEWNALAARFVSAAAFARDEIRPAEGPPLAVSGWVLDWRAGRVTHLLAQYEGAPRALSLLSLTRVDGGWKANLGLEALGTLPVFVTDVPRAAVEAAAPSAPSAPDGDEGSDEDVGDAVDVATKTAH